MKQVALYEAKNTLSALIDEVERTGEEVIITRHGKPVARIGGVSPKPKTEGKKALGLYLTAELAKQRAAGVPTGGPSWEELKAEIEDEIG